MLLSLSLSAAQMLYRQHAGTMIQFMWQADLHGVAKFIRECLGRWVGGKESERRLASDQP